MLSGEACMIVAQARTHSHVRTISSVISQPYEKKKERRRRPTLRQKFHNVTRRKIKNESVANPRI